MATMTREWGKEEGEDVEAEAAVVASTTATAEMPTIRLALLHQSTQLSQSHPQAPACQMAQEGLPWAEGSRSTLPQMLHLSQMLRLSQMLPSGYPCDGLLPCSSSVSYKPWQWSFAQVLKPIDVVCWFILMWDLKEKKIMAGTVVHACTTVQ